jgi:hypothetical protein
LGIGPNPQSPIPNPQSPIPNPHIFREFNLFLNKNKKIKWHNYILKLIFNNYLIIIINYELLNKKRL